MLAASIALAGCSKAPDEAEGEKQDGDVVTLNVSFHDDFAGFRKSVIEEFESENPGIKVNFMSVGYDPFIKKR